uniref:Cell division control protein n=1 Tax=Ganoderma boninense TaxID=34458 RepID=A0A5K1K0S0_9APHY|nr:Cell division control protein [Ganoderma boninense]
MSQYSLSTTDPLRKGSRERVRKIRLPWKADNGVRKQQLYDIGAASLIFDAGTIDTTRKSSTRANSKRFWSRKHTPDTHDDATTPTQDHFGPAVVLGGTLFESPSVSRAGTAESVEMVVPLPDKPHMSSNMSPQNSTLVKGQRGWKISSPLSGSARRAPESLSDTGCEIPQQPTTFTTQSALTRVFGIFSRR